MRADPAENYTKQKSLGLQVLTNKRDSTILLSAFKYQHVIYHVGCLGNVSAQNDVTICIAGSNWLARRVA